MGKCIVCGEPLKLGEFAYNQEQCWPCFEQKVKSIAKEASTNKNAEIILHLLAIAKEAHRIKDKYVPLLYKHDIHNIIGTVYISTDSNGEHTQCSLNEEGKAIVERLNKVHERARQNDKRET
jgi:uncharacterized protein with NRDE domain